MAKRNSNWVIGVSSFLIMSFSLLNVTSASNSSNQASITWDLQVNSSTGWFQSIGMCKGTTDATRKVGFIGNELGSIWRTLDGKNWKQVVQFPSSAYWYGIFCLPDAQRVIAVGFSDGDEVMDNGAIFTWSFDGGNTWTERQPLPYAGSGTWLQSVYFYNDTHGIILPFIQDTLYVIYYTTNGGKNPSDWKAAQPETLPFWTQSHSIWPFSDNTRTFAQDETGSSYVYTTNTAGRSWQPALMNSPVVIGSFVSSNDSIGVDYSLNVYSSSDGGVNWKGFSSLPSYINDEMVLPSDMVWIPNSDIVILIGGNDYPDIVGTVAHSTDGGISWIESMPDLPPTLFNSIDLVAISDTTYEVWAVGANDDVTNVLHAVITLA